MRVYRRITQVIHSLGIVLIFLLFLMITISVIMRYVFGRPLLLADEIAFYIFFYAAMMAIAYAYTQKAHIRLDLVTARLSEPAQRWLRVVANILEVAVWVVILWQGTRFCVDLITRTHTTHPYVLPIPLWWTAIGVPIAALLILVDIILSEVIPSIAKAKSKGE